MNKILVGVVTSNVKDYCYPKFAKQLKGLQAQGHDVLIIDNSMKIQPRKGFKTIHFTDFKGVVSDCFVINNVAPPEQQIGHLMDITCKCMNILRDEFLKGDYTHLFILESDVFIEKDTVDRLLDMKADVANFTYLMNLERFDDYSLCVQATKDNRARMITPEMGRELINTGIKTLAKDMLGDSMLTHCGYGCTLVKREVLEKVSFRTQLNSKDRHAYPDSCFHYDVNINGFTNKLNTDWLPLHENLNDETVTMLKILQIQSKTTRRERRKGKK